jgi:hypothetical protein
MAPNPLSAGSILQLMADAIPTHPKGDTTSDISSSYEVLALLNHACMTALKFRLQGFDEDRKIGKFNMRPVPHALISSHTDKFAADECERLAPRLPPSWNASFGSHSFVYAHKQSAMLDIIKVDRLGSKAEVRGLAVGHEVIHRLEISVRDYIKSSSLPIRIKINGDGSEDRSDLPEKLKQTFASQSAMEDLVEKFKTNIIQKLIPKMQIEGYEESPDDRDAAENANQERRTQEGREPGGIFPDRVPRPGHPYPMNDPLVEPPRRPVPVGDFAPPGFEDEYEINRPPRGGPLSIPGRSPFNIGHDDLNPPGLGPHDPLRGSFIGGGLPQPGGGSGMHPTFDDPLFGGHGGAGGGFGPQAPPGARWDPVGPGGNPRFPQGGPGGRHNPFGGGFGGDII